jgi:hypothetical protein
MATDFSEWDSVLGLDRVKSVLICAKGFPKLADLWDT